MKNKKLYGFLIMILCLTGIVFLKHSDVEAATYYVDTNGSDANSGLTESQPWQSLKKVNDHKFLPGDKILFKSGSTWNGQLKPQGNGSKDNSIEINKYGGDKKPIINGNGTNNYSRNSGTVMLVNQHDWTIKNLEVTNFSNAIRSQRSGILVINNSNTTQSNIVIDSNYVHDVNSDTQVNGAWKVTGGIILIGINEDLNGRMNFNRNFGFDNVYVKNNHVNNVSTAGIRNKSTLLNIFGSESYPKVNKNISYENNDVENVFGDGMIISEISNNGIVRNNKVNKFCNADTKYNYAGLRVMASDNVLVERNEVSNGRYGNNDGTAFDIDLNCNNIVVQHNYSHDNARGNVLFMDNAKNGIFRYNVSVNDGWDSNKLIFYLPKVTEEKVKIYNNLFITSPTTSEIIKSNDAQRALDFVNNVVISQNPKLTAYNRTDMTGDLQMKNNAIYGFSDKWFEGNNNIRLKNVDSVNKLIKTSEATPSGINKLDITELTNMPELKAAGLPMASNLKDFYGYPVASEPAIGPVEFK